MKIFVQGDMITKTLLHSRQFIRFLNPLEMCSFTLLPATSLQFPYFELIGFPFSYLPFDFVVKRLRVGYSFHSEGMI